MMQTLIINGSPKGNSPQSNSKIFAQQFIKNMQNPCEIVCIAGADVKELAQYAQSFEAIIIVLPLYIHAMPGIVMNFIENLKPTTAADRHLGFILQAGFMETAQHKFVEPYFASLAKNLNYSYLGTVSKGEAAAVYMFPKMFKKLLNTIADLGVAYEKTNAFDPDIVKKLAKPYELSKLTLTILKIVEKIGLDDIGWNKMLKQNNAFANRLDKPFI